MIRSVLVANRGEIAVRVIRAARELGIRAVAVYSEADRGSVHVALADEAYAIGPAPAEASYLNIDALIEVAGRSGADAVHPGYGFLAEREEFARAVEAAGLVFMGPRPDTLAAMGDKTRARARMIQAGVPVVPGTSEPLASAAQATVQARDIGFPVVLKAAAGGGGKGMRVVQGADEVADAFGAASREARTAFGDGRMYLERFLERPRHIEVQLFGDRHGNVVHLFERECSIQRRHQKLIEEAPSPLLSADARRQMGRAAVRAAAAVGYVGAGTIEFLVEDGEFYFLEMNTRLQVEHPVTEMITGVDLVHWQFRVARGDPLPLRQDEIAMTGHAIECRITSEDPFEGFLPTTGTIRALDIPGGPGVRWDGGIARGSRVGLHYDPLLGKLICHGPDRSVALDRMDRALGELRVAGVSTGAPLLRRIVRESDFRAGDLSTAYLEEHPELFDPALGPSERAAAALAAALLEHERRLTGASRIGVHGPRTSRPGRTPGPWDAKRTWGP